MKLVKSLHHTKMHASTAMPFLVLTFTEFASMCGVNCRHTLVCAHFILLSAVDVANACTRVRCNSNTAGTSLGAESPQGELSLQPLSCPCLDLPSPPNTLLGKLTSLGSFVALCRRPAPHGEVTSLWRLGTATLTSERQQARRL